MPLLQSLNNLIKLSQYPQAFVCDFVVALKFWQGYLFLGIVIIYVHPNHMFSVALIICVATALSM